MSLAVQIMKSTMVLGVCVFQLLIAITFAGNCKTHYGKFRDCTCGVQYRDVETRCCSVKECSAPSVRTENLTCPLTCLNNGQKLSDTSSKISCKCSRDYGGACCEKVKGSCGDILFNWKGEIKSPPNTDKPDRVNCTWTIRTDPLRRIALSARTFNVTSGVHCMCNHVIVHDGKQTTKFCGEYFPTLYSSTNVLVIKSYGHPSESSFHFDYRTYFKEQKCGPKTTFNELNGVITSPQYPLNYGPTTICNWAIKVWPGYGLVVKFQNINIHQTTGCLSDYVFVTKTDRYRRQSVITKLCGNRDNLSYYISNALEVRIRFVSNSRTEGKGFKLFYYSRRPYRYIYG